MKLNNISFKSSLLNQLQKQSQSVATTVTALPIIEKKDSVELSADTTKKRTNKKTIIASIIGAGALFLTFLKRKSITKFLKKIFKGGGEPPSGGSGSSGTSGISGSGTSKPPKPSTPPKIEFPKPKFTCGPENADQYAKEKKAYVDSIMPYLYKRDKQLKIQAIEVIEKYGSWEHGDKLGLFLGKRDEEIVVPVVRAIAATGKKDDALLITSFIEDVKDVYTPETFKEILSCAAKLGDVRGWKKNDADILLAPIRRLTKSDNHEVAQAAKDALNKILNK